MRQLERFGRVAEFDRPIRMTRIVRVLFAVTVSVWLAVVTAASTLAAPPTLPTLNTPPSIPAWLTCKATGEGAICSGTTVLSIEDGPSGLFCGTTANPIELLGVDGHTNVDLVRFYDADGNFVGRHRLEQTVATLLNPMAGLKILTTQIAVFSSSFGTPGDFDTVTDTQRGVVKFYLPGAGVLLIDVGRAVIVQDSLFSESGQHQLDQYFLGGDSSVLERVCEALGSPGTPPLP
jgi:hypothetical protein